TCPGCLQPVIAKCGTKRINHWAHRAETACDRWWEPETAWHRAWKNNFPVEWQENIRHDNQTGEKHIADVLTSHGLVMEFQHSHIDPMERMARERFYKNMVWIADGTRLKRDYTRFAKGLDNFRTTAKQGFFLVLFPDECFPAAWLDSTVPVIFDFRGTEPSDQPDMIRDTLWCLLPGRAEGQAVVIAMRRQDFVDTTFQRPQLFPVHEIVAAFAENIRQQRQLAEMQASRNYMHRLYQQNTRRPYRRGFRRF
ncbi:MAG: competence protein CoiA family protein, partial [Candidatus Microsaccharimonas sp.]